MTKTFVVQVKYGDDVLDCDVNGLTTAGQLKQALSGEFKVPMSRMGRVFEVMPAQRQFEFPFHSDATTFAERSFSHGFDSTFLSTIKIEKI